MNLILTLPGDNQDVLGECVSRAGLGKGRKDLKSIDVALEVFVGCFFNSTLISGVFELPDGEPFRHSLGLGLADVPDRVQKAAPV